ncbi:MAG: hypothetical protein US31_C0004G0071 [Berkelbacteria bacterium GW2011_GWA1_36_9]|uniref:Uncharacterized protein n=1 Tax=Berkelbacteria bacterium GW2011_GWA1_36_9 TaxID=1618331 RepID=A0A0G0I2J9_9BACT|nr:MAG: hypothetical protein US31_C0004G0071 [Berkelbacteria bacterium GW2011_GWA1_36_9]
MLIRSAINPSTIILKPIPIKTDEAINDWICPEPCLMETKYKNRIMPTIPKLEMISPRINKNLKALYISTVLIIVAAENLTWLQIPVIRRECPFLFLKVIGTSVIKKSLLTAWIIVS